MAEIPQIHNYPGGHIHMIGVGGSGGSASKTWVGNQPRSVYETTGVGRGVYIRTR